MKINSNTISLDREEYAAVEKVIEKIASDNQIDNVKEVRVVLSPESGTIKFRSAEETEEVITDVPTKVESKITTSVPTAAKDEDEG